MRCQKCDYPKSDCYEFEDKPYWLCESCASTFGHLIDGIVEWLNEGRSNWIGW